MAEKGAEEQKVKEMATGVFKQSNSPWAAPEVLAKKKDNSCFFCVGCRQLSAVTNPDLYPLLYIDNASDQLASSVWFHSLHLQSVYWQVALTSDAKVKTVSVDYEKLTMKAYGNGSEDCLPVHLHIKHLYLPAMYGIISVVGLMGNLTAITVYVVKLRPWKSGSVVMVNLTMADLLYALSLPFLVHFYSTGDWTLCEFMCHFLHSCFHFNMYSSVLFLACFSVFRHEAVVYLLWAAHVQRK
ncbi:hypothetical protein P4O66_008220 [Electrophorus voltai]|uniref:G-protein coupled receptors family 1 profile domain-containing protein n=1 Tax=Electrophorus voltai TaxID=2609070 RepID=A0AAD8ZF21_9TELE|nr:hypothetical protein P4O66_008220 [Electrophorus voltai]